MNGYEQREYEPLKENYAGLWSRRIDAEHRLISRAADDAMYIITYRYHCE